MPRTKKHPSTRARPHKASTSATLVKPSDRALHVAADYGAMTVPQLKDEIDGRNEGRHLEAKVSKRGTKASLVKALVDDDDTTPRLPEREQGWHPMTRTWWADVWASPMSPEWDESDVHNVYILAALYDDVWTAPSPTGRKEAMTEYRLQRADLGLSPYSRRRLEWSIENVDEARDRGNQRRARRSGAEPTSRSKPDPRAALHSVK